MEHSSNLYDLVKEALDDGVKNNPEMETWTISDLAADLKTCCADLEHFTLFELFPSVQRWRAEYRNRD